jgi:cyanophycinase-like exopeptidase
MKNKFLFRFSSNQFVAFLFLFVFNFLQAQTPKGKLFIIGGGDRSDALMKQVLAVAELSKKDYIVVLPMSSEEPDSSFIFFKNPNGETHIKSNCDVEF